MTSLLFALALAGCAHVAAPTYHGARSDHFDGKRFFNYERTPELQLEDALRRHQPGRHRGHWDEWQETPTDTPPPRVAGGELRVTFVNHATVLVQTDSLNIIIDPVWSDRVSPFAWYGPKRHRPPGIRFEDLPPIDVVLLSHNHYDHMDLPTLRRLVAAFHPRIVTGLGNGAFLAKNGIAGADDIDWWQSVALASGVRLTGVPARHWSARSTNDVDRTLWLGFVLESPSGRIYFAGDTGYGQFFTILHDRFPSFRLALLPIAPARPHGAMAPRHMSAGDAVRAAELLHVETSIAIHFGTFEQGDDGQQEPVDSLTQALVARPSLRFSHYATAKRDGSLRRRASALSPRVLDEPMALGREVEDRRRGPSRLSTWTGRRMATLWLVWPGIVLTLVAIGVIASLRVWHGASEVRSDVTRSNLIGLATVVIFPPACLTLLWWRMRRRRRASS